MQIGFGSKTKEGFAGTAKPSLCAISRQLLFFLLGDFLFGCFLYGFFCGFLCHSSVTSFQIYSELCFSLLCQRALFYSAIIQNYRQKVQASFIFFAVALVGVCQKRFPNLLVSFSVGKEERYFRQILRQFSFS